MNTLNRQINNWVLFSNILLIILSSRIYIYNTIRKNNNGNGSNRGMLIERKRERSRCQLFWKAQVVQGSCKFEWKNKFYRQGHTVRKCKHRDGERESEKYFNLCNLLSDRTVDSSR